MSKADVFDIVYLRIGFMSEELFPEAGSIEHLIKLKDEEEKALK